MLRYLQKRTANLTSDNNESDHEEKCSPKRVKTQSPTSFSTTDVGILDDVRVNVNQDNLSTKGVGHQSINPMNGQGQVVHLNKDLSKDEDTQQALLDEVTEEQVEKGLAILEKVLDSTVKDKVSKLLRNRSNENKFEVTIQAEQTRALVHRVITNCFQKRILSREEIGSDGVPKVMFSAPETDDEPQRRKSMARFLHFTIQFENKTIEKAMAALANNLKTPPSHFKCQPGTSSEPQKKAVKTVRVSVRRQLKSKWDIVAQLGKKSNWYKISDVSYEWEPLDSSTFIANHCELILRDVLASASSITKTIESFLTSGFVNYFPAHFFGYFSVPSWRIGVAYANEEYEKVVQFILEERHTGEIAQNYGCAISQAVLRWTESHQPELVLNMLPKSYEEERSIMKSFCEVVQMCQGHRSDKLGGDNGSRKTFVTILQNSNEQGRKSIYRKAALSVSKEKRMGYLHAVQSFLWNIMTSTRIRNGQRNEHGVLVPIVGDLVRDSDVILELTVEMLGKYTIDQVVLPVPGRGLTVYPTHSDRSQYDLVAKSHGVDLDKVMEVQGSYREIVAKPISCDWVPLEGECEDATAITVRMALKQSQYPEMAIREITRT